VDAPLGRDHPRDLRRVRELQCAHVLQKQRLAVEAASPRIVYQRHVAARAPHQSTKTVQRLSVAVHIAGDEDPVPARVHELPGLEHQGLLAQEHLSLELLGRLVGDRHHAFLEAQGEHGGQEPDGDGGTHQP